jgi:hypothetical protein
LPVWFGEPTGIVRSKNCPGGIAPLKSNVPTRVSLPAAASLERKTRCCHCPDAAVRPRFSMRYVMSKNWSVPTLAGAAIEATTRSGRLESSTSKAAAAGR